MTRSTRWRGLALILGLSAVETAASEPGRVVTGTTTTVARGATINLREAAARDRRAPRLQQVQPSPAAIRPPMPIPDMPPDNAAAAVDRTAPAAPAFPDTPLAQAPPLAAGYSFRALEDVNTSIPPDTHGAVGPNHLMVTLNTQVRVQSRAGVDLSTLGLDTFWNPVITAGGTFDPRVVYDHLAGRWVTVACEDQNDGAVLVGVSRTANPLGTWDLFRIPVGGGHWADYPTLGFNRNWVAVQANIYTNADVFVESRVYAINRTLFYQPTATLSYKPISLVGMSGTQVPAVTYEPAPDELYLLQNYSSAGGQLRIYELTGSYGSESIQLVGSPSSPATPWSPGASGGVDFAPQTQGLPGCQYCEPVGSCIPPVRKIQTGDARIQNVVYRNGHVWAAHTVFFPAGGNPTRSSVQWWQITPAASIVQRGLVDDPSDTRFFAYPSLAVNKNDDVLLGYSRFQGNQFAGASYSYRTAFDPPNFMQSESTLKDGSVCYYKDFYGPKNRWGDYSATVVDPTDDKKMWTIQEYAASSANAGQYDDDRWGTWWGMLDPTPAISIASVSRPEGDSGPTPFTFTLTLSLATSQTVTVNWATANGTATTADADYAGASGLVTFNPGETSATFDVQVNGDPKYETDETFSITLSTPVNATLANPTPPQATGTILNDDPLPQISIGDVLLDEGNSGTAPATAFVFPVTLSNPSAFTISVSRATANGSAVAPADYAAISGTVTFNPGVVSQSVTVQVVGDTIAEPNEVFYVDLSVPSAATLLKSRGVGTIRDDDTINAPVRDLVVVSDGGAVPATTAGRNRLQWLNPVFAGTPKLRIRWNTSGGPGSCVAPDPAFPNGASGGVVTPDPDLVGSGASQTYEDAGQHLDWAYCYTVWVVYLPGPVYSAGLSASGRPFDATGLVKWKYFTGATAVAPPTVGLGAVIGASNDTRVHAMQRGPAGGPWPNAPWTPVALGSIAQTRSPIVPLGGVSVAFIATQDGRVTAINTATGVPVWSTPLTPASGQAAPAGIFTDFGGAWSYVLVGTRENSTNNRFYALDPATGNVVDYYPKAGDPEQKVGPINGAAAVDYATGRVYFGSLEVGAATETFWCLQAGSAADALTFQWTLNEGTVGSIDGSPVLRNGRVYVGNTTGTLFSFNATDGGSRYTYTAPVDGTGIKGFAFPDRGSGALYFATSAGVYAVNDTGSALLPKWTTAPNNRVNMASPSVVLLRPGTKFLYVGSSDVGGGKAGLFELDVSLGDPGPTKKSVPLESTSAVIGAPSLDIGYNLLHVGSEAGILYAVQVPF